MAKSAPGKHYRKGITLVELVRMFPDDAAAEAWFAETRWPDGVVCPHCESFWALLKRGYQGTYHHLSPKHLDRYVTEFEGRHNDRPADTIDQMRFTAQRIVGKRLPYAELVA